MSLRAPLLGDHTPQDMVLISKDGLLQVAQKNPLQCSLSAL